MLFETHFPDDYKSPLGNWLEHEHDLANLVYANLKHVAERELTRRNRTRHPATFKVGDHVACTPWGVVLRALLLFAGPILSALSHYKNRWIKNLCEMQSPPQMLILSNNKDRALG